MKWELVQREQEGFITKETHRMSTPSGWIVRTSSVYSFWFGDRQEIKFSEAVTFVPDVARNWALENTP